MTWKDNQYFGSNYKVYIEVFVPSNRICSVEKELAFLQCKEFENWLFIVLVHLAETAYLETAGKHIAKKL